MFVQQHLRDEHGNLYSPDEYNLQQSPDGRIHLLPRRLNSDTQHRQSGSQSQQQQQQQQLPSSLLKRRGRKAVIVHCEL